MQLSHESEKRIREAFESARLASKPIKGLYKIEAPEPWKKSENKFESDVHDMSLQFDYNKNPDVVPPEEEKMLQFIMQVVQQQGTSALQKGKRDFTKDIEFYARYPLLFNFQQRESKTLQENNFSLSVNTDLVKACIDDNAPENIKNAFIKALQDSQGNVFSTTVAGSRPLELARI